MTVGGLPPGIRAPRSAGATSENTGFGRKALEPLRQRRVDRDELLARRWFVVLDHGLEQLLPDLRAARRVGARGAVEQMRLREQPALHHQRREALLDAPGLELEERGDHSAQPAPHQLDRGHPARLELAPQLDRREMREQAADPRIRRRRPGCDRRSSRRPRLGARRRRA